MKKILVLGAGGFIGNHMVNYLKKKGYWVRGVDLKFPEFNKTSADDFIIGDLTSRSFCDCVFNQYFDQVYQFAADMGGAGYVFTGNNDANIMHNSTLINLNVLDSCYKRNIKNVFYSSSACIYPEYNQLDPMNPNCEENSVYPASPDSEYGWEKLFSERLYINYARNYGINVQIARYHNIFGPLGTWKGGREKAPAALCRKVIMAKDKSIEIWGDGKQTRSFLFIDDCIEGTDFLIKSKFNYPVNIGSEEMVSINQLTDMIIKISGKTLYKKHIPGPLGVRGRTSNNNLVFQETGWKPRLSLYDSLIKTYKWIQGQINDNS